MKYIIKQNHFQITRDMDFLTLTIWTMFSLNLLYKESNLKRKILSAQGREWDLKGLPDVDVKLTSE